MLYAKEQPMHASGGKYYTVNYGGHILINKYYLK